MTSAAAAFQSVPIRADLAPWLPRYEAAAALGSRLLHDRRLAAWWRRVAQVAGVTVALVPLRGGGSGLAGAAPGLYRLAWRCDQGEGAIALSCEDGAWAALARQDPGDALHALALEVVIGDLARALAQTALPGFRFLSLQALPPERAPPLGWCAIRGGAGELARIAVLDVAPRLQTALQRLAAASPGSGGLRSRLRMPLRVVLGRRALVLGVLQGLQSGDVVLFEGSSAMLPARAVEVHAGTLCAAAVLQENRIELTGAFLMAEHEGEADAPRLPAENRIGGLELPVHFEIETVAIPLSELESIEPGYVIELGMPVADARLRLVTCGTVIGEADLVAVGNRLGARITHMVSRHDADDLDR